MLTLTPGVHCSVTPPASATVTGAVDNAEYVPKLKVPYSPPVLFTRQPATMLALTGSAAVKAAFTVAVQVHSSTSDRARSHSTRLNKSTQQ